MYINILCLFVNASNIPVIFYCCSRKYIFLSAVLIYNFFHHVSGFIFSPLWDWSVWRMFMYHHSLFIGLFFTLWVGSGLQRPSHGACHCSWRCRGSLLRRWSSRTSFMRRNVVWRRWWRWWVSATRCTGCRGSLPVSAWCSSQSFSLSLYSR